MKKINHIVLFIVFIAMSATAQNNYRMLRVAFRDTIYIQDSLTIVPNSVSVQDSMFRSLMFQFFQEKNMLVLFSEKKLYSVEIRYRVLPFLLEKKFSHADSSKIFSPFQDNWRVVTAQKQNSTLPDNKELDYSGSFSRGLAVGNNQDLVLNSNFNLQMSGKLSEDIEVNAAITDNNIPIQADGNTAQLKQFDRIFIELKKKNTSLSAGDFELAPPNTYFMNYFKRVQGLSVTHIQNVKKGYFWQTKNAVAVSRGKFSRQLISSVEGNQGPYRLSGAEGEQLIVVIAGTEKIYADGNLLKRGFENDYVIDYNQGTLFFTAKRLISKDIRIVAEFEYNDQSYVRATYMTGFDYKTPRARYHFNLYGEQDGRNNGLQGNLKDSDKEAFTEAGDAPDGIFASGIDTVKVFSVDRVLYKKTSDLQGNTFFEYSQSPDSASFALRFVEVGFAKGNYVLQPNNANGRVYKYVGEGNGIFLIGTKLNAPKSLQLYTLGADYQLFKKKNALLKTELALSNRDDNRFSTINDENNIGIAILLSYEQKKRWNKKWTSDFATTYEGLQANFKALNPYRSVEFARDWNVENPIKTTEQLIKTNINFRKDSSGLLQYEFSQFLRTGFYEGLRHAASVQWKKNTVEIIVSDNYLETKSASENSVFHRPKIDIKKTFNRKILLGIYGEQEKNQRFLTDTLSRNSFYYHLWRMYAQIPSSKKLQFSAYYQQRLDYAARNNNFLQSVGSNEATIVSSYKSKKGFSLSANLSYRQLFVNAEKLTSLQPQETYLGRVDMTISKWKNAFFSQTGYELGSGQEQRIEYFYQKVDQGKGNFTWRDVNKDTQIQQDEVFPVVFQDSANIIRFILPTNQFVRTNNLLVSQVLQLTPKNYFSLSKKRWKKKLSLFATESALQIQRKVKLNAPVSPWNPFEQLAITDTALVAYSTNIRNVFFVNKGNIKYDFQIGNNDNSNRSILTTGYDIRQQQEVFFRVRWNTSQTMMLRATVTKNTKRNESEFFKNRNYLIHAFGTEPEITWQPSRNFRIKSSYKYSESIDSTTTTASAKSHDIQSEITYNQSVKTAVRAKINVVNIAYVGAANTPVQYAMLNGLLNGKNYLWGLQLNQALNKTLQLEFRYEGRKTGTANIIHTGNMAIRAVF